VTARRPFHSRNAVSEMTFLGRDGLRPARLLWESFFAGWVKAAGPTVPRLAVIHDEVPTALSSWSTVGPPSLDPACKRHV